MTALPASVPLVTVTGWFTQAVADTDDTGREPDVLAMEGTITFTPNVDRVKVLGGDQPMTVFPKPIVCGLDENGYLLGPDGTRDVVLIATGVLIPTYTITYNLDGIPRFAIRAALPPSAEPTDLANVTNVPSNPAADMSAWAGAIASARAELEALVAAATAAADRAEAAAP